ncbi:MAG: hypothetical protein WC197_10140 [Candidatus Gastranaerophilaceae bacterium]|jgi:hypothetical protein
MIIKAFSEELHSISADIPPVILLARWIKAILLKEPENNAEKIIHKEICLAKNKMGLFILVGKSETGQNLLESLYNFALSFEHHKFAKWLHYKKASDFNRSVDK